MQHHTLPKDMLRGRQQLKCGRMALACKVFVWHDRIAVAILGTALCGVRRIAIRSAGRSLKRTERPHDKCAKSHAPAVVPDRFRFPHRRRLTKACDPSGSPWHFAKAGPLRLVLQCALDILWLMGIGRAGV